MSDLCKKCAGWVRGSKTADDMNPETWCTCLFDNQVSSEEDQTEED